MSGWIVLLLAVAAFVAPCLPCLDRISAAPGSTERVRASFNDAADGLGDGISFPAEVGYVKTLLPPGRTLLDLGPKSGISNDRLYLSNSCSVLSESFGVRVHASEAIDATTLISFVLKKEDGDGGFQADVTDGTTTDLAAVPDVTDGTITDLISIECDSGKITVNGHSFVMTLTKGERFLVEIGVYPVTNGEDFFEVAFTNLETGVIESWSDGIDGGFRPVGSLDLVKKSGRNGTFSIDDVAIVSVD